MGWMLRDPKLAMLQTPHHFYSPDPFERNLGQFRVIPNEGELFYGIVQDGNDFWNATFFCGSCAVLRRKALDEIGGIAVETVTEDAHTSLRMQMNGWGTAYINIPQAAGLATERLSAHVGQRIRWARGHDPDSAHRQSALCAGAEVSAAAVLLQRHVPFSLCGAAADLPYRAVDLSAAEPHQHSRLLGGHSGLRPAPPYAVERDQLAHSGRAPALVLERDLRDGALALHSAAHDDGADQSQAGQVQRDGQGRRGEADLLRHQDRATVPDHAAASICGAHGGHSALLHLGPRPAAARCIMNVIWCCFNMVILGVCTAVAREMRQLRTTVRISDVSTPRRWRQHCPDGPAAGRRRDHRHVVGRHQHPLRREVGFAPQTQVRLAFPIPLRHTEFPPPWSPLKDRCCACVLRLNDSRTGSADHGALFPSGLVAGLG